MQRNRMLFMMVIILLVVALAGCTSEASSGSNSDNGGGSVSPTGDVDPDNDGVRGANDKCPNTKGDPINSGCPRSEEP